MISNSQKRGKQESGTSKWKTKIVYFCTKHLLSQQTHTCLLKWISRYSVTIFWNISRIFCRMFSYFVSRHSVCMASPYIMLLNLSHCTFLRNVANYIFLITEATLHSFLKIKTFSENMERICRRKCHAESAISIKLQSNFIKITLRHGCSPENLLYIFRTPSPKTKKSWQKKKATAKQKCHGKIKKLRRN